MLKADLHTHSIGSGHGYSSISENAHAAYELGLELIAITDHGPAIPSGAHQWYFWNLHHVPGLYKGLRILRGCEANLVTDGETHGSQCGLDIAGIVLERLDYVEFGFHPTCGYDQGDKEANTEAVLRAMASPWVDQFNHPGNVLEYPIDVDAVIAAAIEHRVVLELNNSTLNPLAVRSASAEYEMDFAVAAYEAGALLALNSDAHHAQAIGNFEPGLTRAKERGIPEDYFLNYNAQRVLDFVLSKRERPLLSSCLD